jgi:hypothetical protein
MVLSLESYLVSLWPVSVTRFVCLNSSNLTVLNLFIVCFLQYYLYTQKKIRVFPKVLDTGLLIINIAIFIFELIEKPSFEYSQVWTSKWRI